MQLHHGQINDYFSGIACKRLTPTDVDPETSNGHELQGITLFKKLFGTELRHFSSNCVYADDGMEPIASTVVWTWYDARAKSHDRTGRSEWRFYYAKSAVPLQMAQAGDLAVVCVNKFPQDTLSILLIRAGSETERQVAWLFGIDLEKLTDKFTIQREDKRPLNFFTEQILEKLGVQIKSCGDEEELLEELLARFPKGFPTSAEFSALPGRSLTFPIAVMMRTMRLQIGWR